MGLAIKQYVEPTGQRNAVIVDSESGIPKFWPTLYNSSQLRAAGKTSNSIVAHLRSILLLYRWAEMRKLDLEDRILSAEGFTQNEIDSLVTLLRSRTKDLSEFLSPSSKVVSLNSKASPKVGDIWRELEERPKQINAASFNDRLLYCGSYLVWLANYLSDQDRRNSTDLKEAISDIGMTVKASLKAMKSVEPNTAFDSPKDIPPQDIKRILELIKPESPTNPWVGRGNRIRNFAIVAVLLDTGLRSGELLSEKLQDVIFAKKNSKGLRVRRRQGSKDDRRKRQPGTKRDEREVPLSEAAYQALDYYVRNVRNQIPGAEKTSYLFLSDGNRSKGKPMSSITSITDDIRSLTGIDLTPHKLRHTATWRYCVAQKKAGRKWDEFVEQLCLKFGWSSPQSPTVRHYAKRYIREELFANSIREQNRLDTEVAAGLEAAKRELVDGQ